MLVILGIQFSSVENIHIVFQQILRTFHLPKLRLCLHSMLTPFPQHHCLLSVSVTLTTPGTFLLRLNDSPCTEGPRFLTHHPSLDTWAAPTF